MATFTFPAHAAMFQGFLPHVFEPEPFYNRYCQQLWRISHRDIQTKPLVTFPGGTKSVVCGFRDRGYATLGVAAMYWFKDADVLRDGFAQFAVTGFDAHRQNETLLKQIRTEAADRPLFAFVNYGETHSPFRYQGMPPGGAEVDERFSLSRLFNQQGLRKADWQFDSESFQRQIACAGFLDARMGELIAALRERSKPTTVVVCGDHGECFGEDGLFGHAFYHEKVMEVPLLIFRLNAPPHAAPEPNP